MAVDLSDFLEAVKTEVTAPEAVAAGNDAYWLSAMSNAFWEARLEGHFVGYSETEGIIDTVPAGGADLPREQIQLLLLYTAYKSVFNRLVNLKTKFRGKAGPTEIETERSAQVLTAALRILAGKMEKLKDDLTNTAGTAVYLFDAVQARQESLEYGDGDWTG